MPPVALAQAYYALARFRGFEEQTEQGLAYMELADAAASRIGPARIESLSGSSADGIRFNIARDMAWLLRDLGRYDESVRWANQAVQMVRDGRIPKEDGAMALYERGQTYSEAGRLEEAVATLRETVAMSERHKGADGAETAYYKGALGMALLEAGAPGEGVPFARDGLAVMRQTFGTTHDRVAFSMTQLGRLLLADGRPREAAVALDSSWAIARAVGTAEQTWVLPTLMDLSAARSRLGEPAEAARAAREAIRVADVTASPTWVPRARAALGIALVALRREDEARPHLRAALAASGPGALTESEAGRARRALLE